jgi:hypothetical protein
MTEVTQETTTTVSEESIQETSAQPTGSELNISDLNALKSIVDVATQRGAFKAAELEAVGKVYNRLSSFLDSVTKKD